MSSNPSSQSASVKYQFRPQALTSSKASCRSAFILTVYQKKMLINEITVFENHSKCLALKFLHFQLSLVYPNQLSAQARRYVTH